MDQTTKIRCLNLLCDENCFWFAGLDTNYLFCFDMESGKTRMVCTLAEDMPNDSYYSICLKDGRLYLAPLLGDRILIFDIGTQKLEQVRLKHMEQYRRMPAKGVANFSKAYVEGDYVFLIPYSFGAIVRLNVKTKEVVFFDEFVSLIAPMIRREGVFWFEETCQADGKIYMPCCCADAVVIFDMKTCKCVLCNLKNNKEGYSGICICGNSYWLLNYEGDTLYKWDGNQKIEEKIELERKKRANYIYAIDNKIIRISYNSGEYFDLIDAHTYQCKKISIKHVGRKTKEQKEPFYAIYGKSIICAGVYKDYIYIYSVEEDALCFIDQTGKCVKKISFEATDLYQKFVRRFVDTIQKPEGANLFIEDHYCGLDCLLSGMKRIEDERRREMDNCCYGEDIYRMISKDRR